MLREEMDSRAEDQDAALTDVLLDTKEELLMLAPVEEIRVDGEDAAGRLVPGEMREGRGGLAVGDEGGAARGAEVVQERRVGLGDGGDGRTGRVEEEDGGLVVQDGGWYAHRGLRQETIWFPALVTRSDFVSPLLLPDTARP